MTEAGEGRRRSRGEKQREERGKEERGKENLREKEGGGERKNMKVILSLFHTPHRN